MYVHMHIHIHTYKCILVYMYVYIFASIYIYTYMYLSIYMYIHICINICNMYVHIHMSRSIYSQSQMPNISCKHVARFVWFALCCLWGRHRRDHLFIRDIVKDMTDRERERECVCACVYVCVRERRSEIDKASVCVSMRERYRERGGVGWGEMEMSEKLGESPTKAKLSEKKYPQPHTTHIPAQTKECERGSTENRGLGVCACAEFAFVDAFAAPAAPQAHTSDGER